MAQDQYIPAGRTSLVERNGSKLQLQTEYSARPEPRITTTILDNGQLLHKIERKLKRPIDSLAHQHKVEEAMIRQHIEISGIVKDKNSILSDAENVGPKKTITVQDRLGVVSGVRKVYRLDNEGNFFGAGTSIEFQKVFADVFKSLRDIIEIFMIIPGVGKTREKGVYEITPNSLYLVSAGAECYFVVIDKPRRDFNYEAALIEIVKPNPFAKG